MLRILGDKCETIISAGIYSRVFFMESNIYWAQSSKNLYTKDIMNYANKTVSYATESIHDEEIPGTSKVPGIRQA